VIDDRDDFFIATTRNTGQRFAEDLDELIIWRSSLSRKVPLQKRQALSRLSQTFFLITIIARHRLHVDQHAPGHASKRRVRKSGAERIASPLQGASRSAQPLV
jgi:hypothetical protein